MGSANVDNLVSVLLRHSIHDRPYCVFFPLISRFIPCVSQEVASIETMEFKQLLWQRQRGRHKTIGFKDRTKFCYCTYVLRILRYSAFLWVVLTNTGIFLRGLNFVKCFNFA